MHAIVFQYSRTFLKAFDMDGTTYRAGQQIPGFGRLASPDGLGGVQVQQLPQQSLVVVGECD
ncbi:MAG: hypothetical protein EBU46_07145 [Nitrosomonadaceae bacterium]|nr:hypothetical protein [Nitrosomonadaceae bacterium]